MTGQDLKSFKHFCDFKGSDISHDGLALLAMYSLLLIVGTGRDTQQIHRDVIKLIHDKKIAKLHRSRESDRVSRIIHQLAIDINKLDSCIDRLN